jgi:uncharacterized protein (DUF1501 family)
MNQSRRAFLRATAGLAAAAGPMGHALNVPMATSLAGLGALAASQAHAADTSGYKALVCLYLAGGNDSHNWLVPTDTTNYASYAAARAELAIPLTKLQGISATSQASGRTFGLPLELSQLKDWYQAGQCALLANVGTLVRPVTKADFNAGIGLPAKLFSHNDQAATWQSLQPEGAPTGWGGRMGDVLSSANQYPVFTAISAAGNAVFLSGTRTVQYDVSANGLVQIGAAAEGWHAGGTSVPASLRSVIASSGSGSIENEYMKVVQRSLSTGATLKTAVSGTNVMALPTAPITLPDGSSYTLNNDSLAKQLRVVSQLIAAGTSLGMKRQVFMVSIGGFDSHSFEMRDQPLLMSRVSQSVNWFLNAMRSLGMLDKVTLFSASDFGRTLTSNGDGADHGWGGHHFVVGGAVKGGEIYGTMPVTALGTAEDLGSGRLLPTTSVTQYAATLGRWMGLSSTELATVLPNLSSFSPTMLNFI